MMSRNAVVKLDFADGSYSFRLAIGHLEELQEKTAAGPFAVYRRLTSGEWRVADIRETIRLGLIGGGETPASALKLVRRYVDDYPLQDGVLTAQAILAVALFGVEDEVPGKPMGETMERPASTPVDDGNSPDSMAAAQ